MTMAAVPAGWRAFMMVLSPARVKTVVSSLRHLRKLPQQKIDEFLRSYIIYNLDWDDEAEMIRVLGVDYMPRVGEYLRAYYGVLNHLCALGGLEKMYLPPVMDEAKGLAGNQWLIEVRIARELGVSEDGFVLDLGCGRGLVAQHMSKLTKARVLGLNIDPDQLTQARQLNLKNRLNNTFMEHDINTLPLPFEDDTFDASYEIQALSLCKALPALFKEVHRILKPGAGLVLMDWVRLPAYDPNNDRHVALMRRTKPLIGAVGTPTPDALRASLEAAGFDIIHTGNPSIDGMQAPLIERADNYFRNLSHLVPFGIKARVLPPYFLDLLARFRRDVPAFLEMDRLQLVTTNWKIVAEKKRLPNTGDRKVEQVGG